MKLIKQLNNIVESVSNTSYLFEKTGRVLYFIDSPNESVGNLELHVIPSERYYYVDVIWYVEDPNGELKTIFNSGITADPKDRLPLDTGGNWQGFEEQFKELTAHPISGYVPILREYGVPEDVIQETIKKLYDYTSNLYNEFRSRQREIMKDKLRNLPKLESHDDSDLLAKYLSGAGYDSYEDALAHEDILHVPQDKIIRITKRIYEELLELEADTLSDHSPPEREQLVDILHRAKSKGAYVEFTIDMNARVYTYFRRAVYNARDIADANMNSPLFRSLNKLYQSL